MDTSAFRKSQGWTLKEMASRLGIQSRGRASELERGVIEWPTDLAIKMARLSDGALPVSALRPDLHDVRVLRPGESVVSEARA
jgi:transcriptional regulator with XRE-family HTH domain